LSSSELRARARDDSDRDWVESFLVERYSLNVARLGRMERALDHPALVAERDALHRGAVDHSRAHLKPEIPRIGDHGIHLRDELELEKVPGA
jgi:hypothetical protein